MDTKRKKVEIQLSNWNYLFWVGFEALGGAFLRLVPTALFGSWMAPLNLFRFAETEANNLLGWYVTLGIRVSLQQWKDSGEQMSKWETIKAKTRNKALWINFIVLMEKKWKWNREDFGAKTFRSDIFWKKDSTARLTCRFYCKSETSLIYINVTR